MWKRDIKPEHPIREYQTTDFTLRAIDQQAPVVQKVDSAIHWINHYPLDSVIGFLNTYPLDSDLSVEF